MTFRRKVTAITTATLLLGSTSALAAAPSYQNCTQLNRAYPHGVGKPGAHDHTGGTPVTTFKRSAALYRANASKDRDRDGIACEKA
jgi:hypothetical protein